MLPSKARAARTMDKGSQDTLLDLFRIHSLEPAQTPARVSPEQPSQVVHRSSHRERSVAPRLRQTGIRRSGRVSSHRTEGSLRIRASVLRRSGPPSRPLATHLPSVVACPRRPVGTPAGPARAECPAGMLPKFTGPAGSNCPAFTQAMRTSRRHRNRRLNQVPINGPANERRSADGCKLLGPRPPRSLPDAQFWSTSLCGKRSRTVSIDNGTWT